MNLVDASHQLMIFIVIAGPSMSNSKRMGVSISVVENLDIVVEHTFTLCVSESRDQSLLQPKLSQESEDRIVAFQIQITKIKLIVTVWDHVKLLE